MPGSQTKIKFHQSRYPGYLPREWGANDFAEMGAGLCVAYLSASPQKFEDYLFNIKTLAGFGRLRDCKTCLRTTV